MEKLSWFQIAFAALFNPLFSVTRVTGCVREKVAKNVAQFISWGKKN
jgi:hypothetical protein